MRKAASLNIELKIGVNFWDVYILIRESQNHYGLFVKIITVMIKICGQLKAD